MKVAVNKLEISAEEQQYISVEYDVPAVLGSPVLDVDANVWRVPVTADPGTASVEVEVNDAVIEVTLDADGTGEVTIDATTLGQYEITVVGAPEILPGVPVPQCRTVVEVT